MVQKQYFDNPKSNDNNLQPAIGALGSDPLLLDDSVLNPVGYIGEDVVGEGNLEVAIHIDLVAAPKERPETCKQLR